MMSRGVRFLGKTSRKSIGFCASVLLSALFLGAYQASAYTSAYATPCSVRQLNQLLTNSGLKEYYDAVLTQTGDWRQISAPLLKATDPRLKQRFTVKGRLVKGRSSIHEAITLSVKPGDYAETLFVVAKEPVNPMPEGAVKVGAVEFGYMLRDKSRVLGPLNYAVIAKDGRVLEVGGGTPEVLGEFKSHVFGRTLSRDEHATILEINQKIFKYLRSHPDAVKNLKAFAQKRKWPEGLEDKAYLAYFDDKITPVKEWARKNGYSLSQMRDAGWLNLIFDKSGHPIYQVHASNSIKIPYLAESGSDIPLWRSRKIEPGDGPKYLSSPLDRSINREWTPPERLYNGGTLGQAKGKTVIITEGEFKCLVAQNATGTLTVGIPGITEFDLSLAQPLAKADAKEYIVILDRDPRAKALMRADEITDSERAAYKIARELQEAGAKSVRIGIIPDVFQGAKVGIDDLVIAKGPAALHEVVARAVDPDQYAAKISLDPVFQDILYRRQKLGKVVENYENSVARDGPRVSQSELELAKQSLAKVDRAYHDYLFNELNQARSLDEASGRYSSLRRVTDIPNRSNLVITQSDGRHLAPKAFLDDIVLLNYVPDEPALEMDVARGSELAKKAGFEPKSLNDSSMLVAAGRFAHSFPPEEYDFAFNVSFGKAKSLHEAPELVPLVIFRKSSGKAVAIAQAAGAPSRLFEKIAAYLRPEQRLRPQTASRPQSARAPPALPTTNRDNNLVLLRPHQVDLVLADGKSERSVQSPLVTDAEPLAVPAQVQNLKEVSNLAFYEQRKADPGSLVASHPESLQELFDLQSRLLSNAELEAEMGRGKTVRELLEDVARRRAEVADGLERMLVRFGIPPDSGLGREIQAKVVAMRRKPNAIEKDLRRGELTGSEIVDRERFDLLSKVAGSNSKKSLLGELIVAAHTANIVGTGVPVLALLKRTIESNPSLSTEAAAFSSVEAFARSKLISYLKKSAPELVKQKSAEELKNAVDTLLNGEIDIVFSPSPGRVVWGEVKDTEKRIRSLRMLETSGILKQAQRHVLLQHAFGLEVEQHEYFLHGISKRAAQHLDDLGIRVYGMVE